MVTASALFLEEPAPDWIRTSTRRELHDGFDVWLDSLEGAVKEEPTSLDALSRGILGRRQELTAQVTEFLIRQRHAQALGQKNAPCPHCGRLLPARGLVSRTVEPWWGR